MKRGILGGLLLVGFGVLCGAFPFYFGANMIPDIGACPTLGVDLILLKFETFVLDLSGTSVDAGFSAAFLWPLLDFTPVVRFGPTCVTFHGTWYWGSTIDLIWLSKENCLPIFGLSLSVFLPSVLFFDFPQMWSVISVRFYLPLLLVLQEG